MSKIFSAFLLALSLVPIACDDPDDGPIDAQDTGTTGDDTGTTGDDTGTTGDTSTATTTTAGDDDNDPGCLNALKLPPGPATSLDGGC